MIVQRRKSRIGRRSHRITLAEEVEALRRYDWNDPLFDEWCASAARQLACDVNKADPPKGTRCRLASKLCI